MKEYPFTANFVGRGEGIQGGIGQDKGIAKSAASAVAFKDRSCQEGCGIAPFVKFTQSRPPFPYIKITHLAEILGRIPV